MKTIKKENGNIAVKFIDIIIVIILIAIIIFIYGVFQENNFSGYTKSETNINTAQFKRDSNEKYSDINSYKIYSPNYDDAMFSKVINVEKNTPYKVSCMVKTKDVIAKDDVTGVGAQISIADTTERSIAVSGSEDWQKIELVFNSKDRQQIDLGFRLGGYLGECTGTAWFSDFKIESGTIDSSTQWKFACFIFETTDVNINGKEIKLNVTQSDIADITDTILRFETTCSDLSNGKMSADCDIYRIATPLTSLSYDPEFAYYVAPEDVENQIKNVISGSNYDHVFVVVRLGNDQHEEDIQVNDWIGLGSMDYYGIGFSNIRLPNDSKSYTYKYNSRINTFPEEVFLHEFLHSLERTSEEYGYSIPALHDYKDYGYQNEPLIGQKNWYRDYMNKNIKTDMGNIGLPTEVYNLKPAKSNNFEYSFELTDIFKEQKNIFEKITSLITSVIPK